jgi:hypothetical protein
MPSSAAPAHVRLAPVGAASAGVMRRCAVMLPLAAVAAGYAVPGSRRAASALRLLAAAVPPGAVLLAHAGRAAPPAPCGPPSGGSPQGCTVTLLVPARDEAPVIAQLVADVAAARSDPMSLTIVDDASVDGTGDLAAAAIEVNALGCGASVVRLTAPSGSKAAALRAAPVAPGVVVVLDADARLTPGFVDRVRAAAGLEGVAQARRRMLRPAGRSPTGWWRRALAFAQDGEQAVDDRIARARFALGGAAELRGDGMVIGTGVLDALGGWPADALCEDLELATRWYLHAGRGVPRPPGLEVWEQPVLSVRSLLAQRLRWAEGSIRRDLRLVVPAALDARVPVRMRAEVVGYAAQALVPWAVLGLALRAVGVGRGAGRGRGARASRDGRARTPAASAWRLLATVAAGYGTGAVILAWAALEDGLPGPGANQPGPVRLGSLGRLVQSMAVAAFTGLWPVVLPVAWIRVARRPGSPHFARTPHVSPAAFSGPEPPRTPRT